MTKTIIIPDIHNKSKHILSLAERVMSEYGITNAVFLGDYVDDWDQVGDEERIRQTLSDLREFASKYNSHFLVGNHDANYLCGIPAPYSTWECKNDIFDFLKETSATTAVEIDGILLSHAGLNDDLETWMLEPAVEHIDELYHTYRDPYGILWCRPHEITTERKQIVGHTPVEEIFKVKNTWIADVFSTTRAHKQIGKSSFIILEDGEVSVVEP